MTDFIVKVPNISVDMHTIAPNDDENKVRKEMNRPTFQGVLSDVDHSSLRYLSFEEVRNKHETVQEAGPLQSAF